MSVWNILTHDLQSLAALFPHLKKFALLGYYMEPTQCADNIVCVATRTHILLVNLITGDTSSL